MCVCSRVDQTFIFYNAYVLKIPFGVRGFLQLAHNFKPSQSQIRHKKLILSSSFSILLVLHMSTCVNSAIRV